jgi:hypothetical protein
LAPSVQEVGSESTRNYNHRTITKELDHAKDSYARSFPVVFPASPETQVSLPSQSGLEEARNAKETPVHRCDINKHEIESLFNELWERYPRKDYRGEAKKVFMIQFPPGASRETITRRLAALSGKFSALEEKAAGLLSRGEEDFIPCLHKWLAKEDFADVGI